MADSEQLAIQKWFNGLPRKICLEDGVKDSGPHESIIKGGIVHKQGLETAQRPRIGRLRSPRPKHSRSCA